MTPRRVPARINIAIAILSLVASSLLWMVQFAQSAKPLESRTFAVPLSPNGLATNQLVVTSMPDSINVVVSAPAARLARLRPDLMSALADVSKAQPGQREYPVQIFPTELRDIVTNGPLMVKVAVEPIKSRRVSVILIPKGELPDPSLRLESLLSDPTRATVTGPRSQVDAVDHIRGFVELGDLVNGASGEKAVELEAVDARDRVLNAVRCEPLFARARLAVAAAPEERTVLVVPSFKGSPAMGYITRSYTITPTQITIRGRTLLLAGLTRVATEPVDLTGMTNDGEFDVAVRLPAGATAVGRGRVKVRVKLEKTPPPAPPVAPEDPQP